MTADRALRLTTQTLVVVGLVALWAADLIGAAAAILVTGVMLLGGWLRERVRPALAVDQVLAVAVAVFAVFDVLYLADRVFDGLVRLLILLVLLRLLTARRPREVRDAGLLTFFMLVASAAVSLGVAFSFVLVAFLVAGTGLLVLAHELTEAERAGSTSGGLAVGRGVVAVSLGGAAGALLVTLVLFFVIPRIGEATLALSSPGRRQVVGFSDRVELGAIGELEMDATVVMRVRVSEQTLAPDLLDALRWRGVALDHFNGHAWSAGRRRRVPLGRGPGGTLELGGAPGQGRPVSQEFFLEPIGTDALFATPRAVRLGLRGGFAMIDDMGALSVPLPVARLQYTVESVVAGKVPERLSAAVLARHLQLPPLSPRIAARAREVTAGTRGSAAAALALTNHLHREYRYTLDLRRTTALEPLEEFLFVRRSGNCEYFASALAVMLRSLGIPARVVTGFQRGEWNPYGEYFLVRMADAHAWVEAYIDGAGWITLDPSPRVAGPARSTWSGASLYFDALRLHWHRYIVSWSRQDQIRAAGSLRRAAVGWTPWRLPGRQWEGRWALPLGALVVGAGAWLLWRGRAPRAAARPAPVPPFYRRALRLLARRGLRPRVDETAREFAGRVGVVVPADAAGFTRLTAAYETVRFGATALAPEERAAIDVCLGALARRRRAPTIGLRPSLKSWGQRGFD